jgi:uncharacterized membrane protein
MFRKAVADKLQAGKDEFRFRGHEVRRIEAFSDAVFAFAVTLLIVSLEVPKNFEELMVTIRGFFAFGLTFILLMLIWYEQNIFFRRYGLDDLRTIVLNCALIFLVLFYIYPLKFLFTILFNGMDAANASAVPVITVGQIPELMVIYGLGYISIYILFSLMYLHALKNAVILQLTAPEIFDTKTKLYKNFILIAIGVISIVLAIGLPLKISGSSGWDYILIGPAFNIFFSYRGKQKRKLYPFPVNSDAGDN